MPVLILQHPLEARQVKGSARLLALSLSRCHLEVAEVCDREVLTDALAALGPHPVLLYPDTPALPVAPTVSERPTGLVVIDATWRKSLKMLHLNPLLLTLPRWALQAPAPSRYAVRKAPRDGQRSTLEATCLALQQWAPEGTARPPADRFEPLLRAFDGFVAALAERGGTGKPESQLG